MIPYEAIPEPIRAALDRLPNAILQRSGSVFYSGKEAFTNGSDLYVLGLNPGGGPSDNAEATIQAYLERFKKLAAPWSEYLDGIWGESKAPGTWGLQPRILHMLKQLGLNPRLVPSSNVVFVKSRNENELAHEKTALLEACWPFHQAVIDTLNVRTILCFGSTAGMWVRDRLGATEQIDTFTEKNNRGWTSRTHRNPAGHQVVTVTHPSWADWRNPLADPTPLVRKSISRAN